MERLVRRVSGDPPARARAKAQRESKTMKKNPSSRRGFPKLDDRAYFDESNVLFEHLWPNGI